MASPRNLPADFGIKLIRAALGADFKVEESEIKTFPVFKDKVFEKDAAALVLPLRATGFTMKAHNKLVEFCKKLPGVLLDGFKIGKHDESKFIPTPYSFKAKQSNPKDAKHNIKVEASNQDEAFRFHFALDKLDAFYALLNQHQPATPEPAVALKK